MTTPPWPNGTDTCIACGSDLPVDRPSEPCPYCGSLARNHRAYAGLASASGVAPNPEAVAEEYRPGYQSRRNRAAVERRGGLSLTRDDGVWRYRTRTYDRAGDRYDETVYNADGSVYHHTSEPLSEHRKQVSRKADASR